MHLIKYDRNDFLIGEHSKQATRKRQVRGPPGSNKIEAKKYLFSSGEDGINKGDFTKARKCSKHGSLPYWIGIKESVVPKGDPREEAEYGERLWTHGTNV